MKAEPMGKVVAAGLLLCGAVAPACNQEPRPLPVPEEPNAGTPGSGWLRGSTGQRFDLVAKHLRGFDMAMVEVGYRYGELYWAKRDGNWGYADYQLKKIETAIANGVERRPARAASARMMEGPLAAVREAISRRNPAAMDDALETFTATCNACHRAEGVPFVQVVPPTVRLSPVQFQPAEAGAVKP